MRLYCMSCATNHEFTAHQVEKIVYELQGELDDERNDPEFGPGLESRSWDCLQSHLDMARDVEGYNEHVAACVERRHEIEVQEVRARQEASPEERRPPPRFQNVGGKWMVRAPLATLQEAIEGDGRVWVRRKPPADSVVVRVDPSTLRPLPASARTQWDGKKPHLIGILPDDPDKE